MDAWLQGKDLFALALSLTDEHRGFFIKHERAVKLLEKFPPQNLLDHFGYQSVSELFKEKPFASVFASLRFAQDNTWMHKFFDEAYAGLGAEDFEEREVELKMLEPEWMEIAAKFGSKKLHNLSHLKELGIIFVEPIPQDVPGVMIRALALLLHYLNEVPFYSKLIKQYSQEPDFVTKFTSLLRGDVPEVPAPAGTMRIVQRYLSKDDPNDWRLAEPHVNPEAEHFYRAEGDMAALQGDFAGWQEYDYIASDEGSSNLMDVVMSLVQKKSIDYHQKEALWNQKFIDQFGRERMNELIEKNIIGGFIEL